ncbi:butyrophilin subfamily 2 member A2-like isoform 2-T2 [Salvelinus alpinus]
METNRRITRSGVLLRVLILAAFTVTITAQKPAPEVFTLTVPNGPILTRLNASVTLPCELSPIFNVEPLEVRWYRSENSNSPALLYKDHKIQETPVDPRYRGRVSLTGGLERGNVSLTLERVTLEDRGEYVCHVSNERWYEKANVYLSMNGSAPVLSVASGGGGQVNVTCSSEGWSPQPKLTWRNKEETEIKNEQVLFTSDSQGLLSVSSWLLYPPSDSDWLSCTISLSEEEKRESRVLPHKPGAWKEAFIVTLVLSLLLLSALSTVVCILLKHRDQMKLEQNKSETKLLFKGTENSQEKRPVKEGINLEDWHQVKAFKENITMDENTAHSDIRVTQEGKTAQYIKEKETIKSSIQRHPHVLANQSFGSEQHYWEVKVRDETMDKAVGDCGKLSWYVGVARDNAERTSKVAVTPLHGFWTLFYEEGKGFHVNTDPPTSVHVRENLSVVGVFLDCENQSLSFYNVDTESHIYTFCNVVTSHKFLPVFSPAQHPITILNEN